MGMSAGGSGLRMLPGVSGRFAAHQIKRRALLVLFIPAERLLVRDFLDVIHADEDEFLRALARLRLSEISSVEMNPFSAPRTRSFLVSARVSMP